MTQGSVEQLISGINDLKVTQNPFLEPQALNENYSGFSYVPSYTATITQMWPAQIARDEYHSDYLARRDELANSAYMGRWNEVFRLVEDGRVRHFEAWMNAARLSRFLQPFGFSTIG